MEKWSHNSIEDRMYRAFQSANEEILKLLDSGKKTKLPQDCHDIPRKMMEVLEAEGAIFWWRALKKYQDTMINLLSSARYIASAENLFDQIKDDPIYFKYCVMCSEVASLLTHVRTNSPKNSWLDRLQQREGRGLNELIVNNFFGDYKAIDLKNLCENVQKKVDNVKKRVVNKEDCERKHAELKCCLDEMDELFHVDEDLDEAVQVILGNKERVPTPKENMKQLTRLFMQADKLIRWLQEFDSHELYKIKLGEDRKRFSRLSNNFFGLWSIEIDEELKKYSADVTSEQDKLDSVQEKSNKIKSCDENVDIVTYYISISEQMERLQTLSGQLASMQGLSKQYYDALKDDIKTLGNELSLFSTYTELKPICEKLAKVNEIDSDFRVMLNMVSQFHELLDNGKDYQDDAKNYKNETHQQIAEMLKGTDDFLCEEFIKVKICFKIFVNCKSKGAKDTDITVKNLLTVFEYIDRDFGQWPDELYQKTYKGKEEENKLVKDYGAHCMKPFEGINTEKLENKKHAQMITILRLVHAAQQKGADANTVGSRYKQNSQKKMNAIDKNYEVKKDDAWYKKGAKLIAKSTLKVGVGAYAGARSVVTNKTDAKGSLWFDTVWKWYHDYRRSVYKELHERLHDNIHNNCKKYVDPVRDFERVEEVKGECQALFKKLKEVNDEVYYDTEQQQQKIKELLGDVDRFIDETRRLIFRIFDAIAKMLKLQEKRLPNDLIALRMAVTYKEKLEEINTRHQSFVSGGNDIESRVNTMVNAQQTRVEIKKLKEEIVDRFDLLSEKSIFSVKNGAASKEILQGIMDNTKLDDFSVRKVL